MQKIIRSALIFCLSSLSVAAQAEETPPATQMPAAQDVVTQPAPADDQPLKEQEDAGSLIPDQVTVAHALQDDILFQRKRRELANELALAKLRAELQKIRQESSQSQGEAMVSPVTPAPAPTTGEKPPPVDVPPQILLVSEVAGVSRVAVEFDGNVKLVEPGKAFHASGKTYRLMRHGNKLVVRELP